MLILSSTCSPGACIPFGCASLWEASMFDGQQCHWTAVSLLKSEAWDQGASPWCWDRSAVGPLKKQACSWILGLRSWGAVSLRSGTLSWSQANVTLRTLKSGHAYFSVLCIYNIFGCILKNSSNSAIKLLCKPKENNKENPSQCFVYYWMLWKSWAHSWNVV